MIIAERHIPIIAPPEDGSTNHHLKLDLRETVIDGARYVAPTYEEMRLATFALAKQIQESGLVFDRIVTLAKGGLTWTRPLMDHLRLERVSMITVESYKGKKKTGKPAIIQPLADDIRGERILLFDEVIDTGETIEAAVDHVQRREASHISTATLVYKPHAFEKTGVSADFAAIFTNAWVVFPHENREFIDSSTLSWLAEGLSIDEVKERLIRIGLPKDETDEYVDKIDKTEFIQKTLGL